MQHDRKQAIESLAQAALDYVRAGHPEHSAVMWGRLVDAVEAVGIASEDRERVADIVARVADARLSRWVQTGQ
ncbi:hypothetical protein [Anaeromyxobacter sp. PSR-1]|uniref:hypothetical protein n=1 Tax=unclassified Anaeromyxobacter TaxID=2620896 RepID=UPI0005DC17A3|nr:hypothetical protein [Anaeromyxobacter sp. PSR-1]GAO01629.1 hypothetical protein PSR1_00485 [Anaeromyxobacter sp. PSR-1]